MAFPDHRTLALWMNDFPDHAMRGAGLSDLTIVNAWDDARALHRDRRVRIWSLDRHLQGYDQRP